MFGHESADNRMTGFVIGGHQLLFLAHDGGLALRAHEDLVLGLFEVVHFHRFLVAAGGEQSGFVDQVGEVGAGEARGAASQPIRFHIVRDGYTFHVDGQNLLTAAHIG